jgi:hypothetical protein
MYNIKIPAKALRGMVDRFTYGEDWMALENQQPEKYNVWNKIVNRKPLTDEEHQLFISDLSSGLAHMEGIVEENEDDDNKFTKQRVSEYKAGIKWIKEYLS